MLLPLVQQLRLHLWQFLVPPPLLQLCFVALLCKIRL